MQKVVTIPVSLFQRWRLSLFEKVILVNSIMLIGEALVGLWITSHNLESHHYFIDTSFIVLATLLTLFTNVLLLRLSFRPLFGLLTTIREINAGNAAARARVGQVDSEIGELAQAFNTMLDRLEEVRRTQTRLILQAQEEERRRIGLELHDEAGQNLTALLVHAEVIQQNIQLLPEQTPLKDVRQHVKEGLHQLTRLTQRTLETIRVLAQQLRPSVLEDLGLQAALRWLVEDNRQRLHLDIHLQVQGIKQASIHSLPPLYEVALFRIAQESLTNIARHAQAKHVHILLKQEQHQLRLQIQDDGRGYQHLPSCPGLGTVGMRERAAQLGGQFSITSAPDKGTTVLVLLPVPVEYVETTMPSLSSEEGLHVL